MTTPPSRPGWYDDPDDPTTLRYFDGVVWTPNTAPRQSPTAAESSIGRATPISSPPAQRRGPWSAGPGSVAPGAPSLPPGGMRRDVLPDEAVLAPWSRRLLARVLDWLLGGVLTVIAAWPWVQELARVLLDYLAGAVRAAESGAVAPDPTEFSRVVLELSVPITFVSLAVTLGYEIGFLAWRGATPGKMALGTVVRSVAGPGRLSVLDAVKRQVILVATTVVGLVPFAGLLASMVSVLDPAWLLWDPRRQALHDKVAGTVVVLARSTARPPG